MFPGSSNVDQAVSIEAVDALARRLGVQPDLSMDDLQDVYDVLRLGMSEPSAILDILDLAGFWLCLTSGRSECVRVVDTDLVYVAVQAPSAPLRVVSFIRDSHDQGWSSYPSDDNTYRNSWSWFDATKQGSNTRKRVQANVHTSNVRRRHVNNWDSHASKIQEWLGRLTAGEELRLIACSRYPGRANHVYEAEVQIHYSCL